LYESEFYNPKHQLTKNCTRIATPVFVNAPGVVLEVGDGLQHGVIIAREYGIPCVSGLPDVTKIIKDGDILSISHKAFASCDF